ncbi:MAG: DUF4298 domain-containing protein [Clostridia bacterium]|nr:DUF4298 domain-containing protein [Clostridia bacterium]
MKRIDRIKAMEECLDRSAAAFKKLDEALDGYGEALADYRKLSDYYGSAKWMQDYEADEAGKLPKDLKRGVLSEDGVYDLITEHGELVARMARFVAESVEKKLY